MLGVDADAATWQFETRVLDDAGASCVGTSITPLVVFVDVCRSASTTKTNDKL